MSEALTSGAVVRSKVHLHFNGVQRRAALGQKFVQTQLGGEFRGIERGRGYSDMNTNSSHVQELVTHIFQFLDVLSGQRAARAEPVGWVQHDSPHLRL